jgi:hypothetical protein
MVSGKPWQTLFLRMRVSVDVIFASVSRLSFFSESAFSTCSSISIPPRLQPAFYESREILKINVPEAGEYDTVVVLDRFEAEFPVSCNAWDGIRA